MAPLYPDTTAKPLEDHEQGSPSADTLLVITVPVTQTSLEFSDYTGSFLLLPVPGTWPISPRF